MYMSISEIKKYGHILPTGQGYRINLYVPGRQSEDPFDMGEDIRFTGWGADPDEAALDVQVQLKQIGD